MPMKPTNASRPIYCRFFKTIKTSPCYMDLKDSLKLGASRPFQLAPAPRYQSCSGPGCSGLGTVTVLNNNS